MKLFRGVLMFGVFVLVLALAPGAVQAKGQSVGRVIFQKGAASARLGDRVRDLEYNALLWEGDRIVTGPGARLGLELADGSIVSLGADTEFVIGQYRFRREEGGSATFELLRGAFRAITHLLARQANPRFTVRTPVATVGIRGTEFWGGFTFGDQLDVLVIAGKGVYVENAAGRVELDAPGLGTTVKNDGSAPAAVKQWPAEKVGKAAAATAWSGD